MHYSKKYLLFFVTILFFVSLACNGELVDTLVPPSTVTLTPLVSPTVIVFAGENAEVVTPTSIPVAPTATAGVAPTSTSRPTITPAPTSTELPPTITPLPTLPTPTASPTFEILPTATIPSLPPTVTPAPVITLTPTVSLQNAPSLPGLPSAAPTRVVSTDSSLFVAIDRPTGNAKVGMNSGLRAVGRVSAPDDHQLRVSLVNMSGQVLAQQTTITTNPNWELYYTTPNWTGGIVYLIAAIEQNGQMIQQDTIQIYLQSSEDSDLFVSLSRPQQNGLAVAGKAIFIDGLAARSEKNFKVAVAIMDAQCQVRYAGIDLTVPEKGHWAGFVIVPGDVIGQICVLATVGDAGSGEYREVHVPMTVVAATDPVATDITVGSPMPRQVVDSGALIQSVGTAYGAVNNQVNLKMQLTDGTVIVEKLVPVSDAGIWQTAIKLPDDKIGIANVTATMNAQTDWREITSGNVITINAPPDNS